MSAPFVVSKHGYMHMAMAAIRHFAYSPTPSPSQRRVFAAVTPTKYLSDAAAYRRIALPVVRTQWFNPGGVK